jgi:hypothetical protein
VSGLFQNFCSKFYQSSVSNVVVCVPHTGFYLQVLRGDSDWHSTLCDSKGPTYQLDCEPCAQAPWAQRVDLSWQEAPGFAWQGSFVHQGTALCACNLETQQLSFSKALSLRLVRAFALSSSFFVDLGKQHCLLNIKSSCYSVFIVSPSDLWPFCCHWIYYQSFFAMLSYLAAGLHCCSIVLQTDRVLFEPANCAIDFRSSHFFSSDYELICCLMVEPCVRFGPSSCAGFHRLPAVSFQFWWLFWGCLKAAWCIQMQTVSTVICLEDRIQFRVGLHRILDHQLGVGSDESPHE